jgi:DNA-binding transcriptional ArsR family regulator
VSVEAEAWAWGQPAPAGSKLVLMALANRADEHGICWPGVKGIATRCSISQDMVRKHLRALRRLGLVNAEPKHRDDGSQTTNLYTLAMSNDGHPPRPDVDATPIVDAEAPLEHTHTLEPSGEQPIEISSSNEEEERDTWPEWYAILWGIKGFKESLAHCQRWLAGKAGADPRLAELDHLVRVARDLASKWAGMKYKVPWLTYQNWVTSKPREQGGGNWNGRGHGADIATDDELEKTVRELGGSWRAST